VRVAFLHTDDHFIAALIDGKRVVEGFRPFDDALIFAISLDKNTV